MFGIMKNMGRTHFNFFFYEEKQRNEQYFLII